MTPTLNTLLLITALWTVPVTTAALICRAYGFSFGTRKDDPAPRSAQHGSPVVAPASTE